MISQQVMLLHHYAMSIHCQVIMQLYNWRHKQTAVSLLHILLQLQSTYIVYLNKLFLSWYLYWGLSILCSLHIVHILCLYLKVFVFVWFPPLHYSLISLQYFPPHHWQLSLMRNVPLKGKPENKDLCVLNSS